VRPAVFSRLRAATPWARRARRRQALTERAAAHLRSARRVAGYAEAAGTRGERLMYLEYLTFHLNRVQALYRLEPGVADALLLEAHELSLTGCRLAALARAEGAA
jgi:hypothetical protein